MLFHFILVFIVSNMRSVILLSIIPLSIMFISHPPSLTAFRIFSSLLGFNILTMVFLEVMFFFFILSVICWDSWIYGLISSINFGKWLDITFPNFFCPILFLYSSYTKYTYIICQTICYCSIEQWIMSWSFLFVLFYFLRY